MLILPDYSSPYVSGEVSLFNTLVDIGEGRAHITLPRGLRIFLVGCLTEHLRDPKVAHRTLALSFLRASEKSGASRMLSLKRTGDAALLLAGLFPERALRLNVGPRYFRFMGQAAYGSLAAQLESGVQFERGRFYNEVARQLPLLERVLDGARGNRDGWSSFQRFLAQVS